MAMGAPRLGGLLLANLLGPSGRRRRAAYAAANKPVWELTTVNGPEALDLVQSHGVDLLLNAIPADAFSTIVHRDKAFAYGSRMCEKLKELITSHVGLVILDSVAMLYRLEMGKTKDVQRVNRDLGVQLAYLTQIARKQHIPVLITNQVYADFEEKDKIKMVGGDLLKYVSKCLVELQKIPGGRRAILHKHRSIEDGKSVDFRIVDKGVVELGP
jgi:RecA/RadA recombinase